MGQRAYRTGLVSSRIWTSAKPKVRMAALIERMVENSFALKLCGVNSMGLATAIVLFLACLVVLLGFMRAFRIR